MSLEALQNPEFAPIQEDLRCQRITWAVERWGWAVMAGLILAAMAGFFGGSTSRAVVTDGTGRLSVTYAHFQRLLAPSQIKIIVAPDGANMLDLLFDKDLIESIEISNITPAPTASRLDARGLLLEFEVNAVSDASADITISGLPIAMGSVRGGIGLPGHAPATIKIFVYP